MTTPRNRGQLTDGPEAAEVRNPGDDPQSVKKEREIWGAVGHKHVPRARVTLTADLAAESFEAFAYPVVGGAAAFQLVPGNADTRTVTINNEGVAGVGGTIRLCKSLEYAGRSTSFPLALGEAVTLTNGEPVFVFSESGAVDTFVSVLIERGYRQPNLPQMAQVETDCGCTK